MTGEQRRRTQEKKDGKTKEKKQRERGGECLRPLPTHFLGHLQCIYMEGPPS